MEPGNGFYSPLELNDVTCFCEANNELKLIMMVINRTKLVLFDYNTKKIISELYNFPDEQPIDDIYKKHNQHSWFLGKDVMAIDSYWFTSDEIEAFREIWQRRISAL